MKGLQISSWMERDQKAQTLCQLRIQRNFWPLSHDSAASHRADPCQYYQATLLAGGTASYLASLYLRSPINFGFPLQPCHQLCEFWQTNSVRVTCAWRQLPVKFQVLVFSCKNCRKMFAYEKKKEICWKKPQTQCIMPVEVSIRWTHICMHTPTNQSPNFTEYNPFPPGFRWLGFFCLMNFPFYDLHVIFLDQYIVTF